MAHSYAGPQETARTEGELANDVEWVIRPYREGDIPAVVDLINAADAVDKLDESTSVAELTTRLAAPRVEPERRALVAEGPRPEGLPEGALVGYGRVSAFEDEQGGERIYGLQLVVHPQARDHGLERVLARRLLDMARAEERDPITPHRDKVWVKTWTRQDNMPARSLWEQMGLKEVRQFWTMERPLHEPIDEPPVIEGVDIRPYRRPEDNKASLEAFNNSFADHFDFHPEPEDMWNFWWSSVPTLRADLSWLAEIEEEPGKIAGFCICEVNGEENERTGRREGWIELLGTIRGWRRKGLGRALLLHGLHSLKSAGLDTAMLGVDAESLTGANHLYESVGFRIRHRGLSYQALLDQVHI